MQPVTGFHVASVHSIGLPSAISRESQPLPLFNNFAEKTYAVCNQIRFLHWEIALRLYHEDGASTISSSVACSRKRGVDAPALSQQVIAEVQ